MNSRQCCRDDRGAILLIALFFAVFGVAILYYAIGIGHAVLFREKLQDATDAAALSAAIVHARAMNLIVLINIVMAAILAVLVTIKLIQALCIIGIAIAAGLAWATFGLTLAAIPPLQSVNATMETTFQDLREPVFNALQLLKDTSDIVSEGAPVAADALSAAGIVSHRGLPGIKGAAVSMRLELPVENDTFPELCGRAGEFPIQLAETMLSPLPGVSEFIGQLESPMHELTSSLSKWFCGDGGTSAPSRDEPIKTTYPRTQLATDCKNSRARGGEVDPKLATSTECESSQRDERNAEPDRQTGNCQAGHDCGISGPYEAHLALAREQCKPGTSPPPIEYSYQIRTANIEYRWIHAQWARSAVTHGAARLQTSERQPCGISSFPPLVSNEYNTVVRKSDDVNEILPVCSDEPMLFAQSLFWDTKEPHYLTVTEVTHIIGCTRKETVHVDLSGGQPANESGNDKSPKRVLTSAKQWGEEFQIRAFVHANPDSGVSESIVRLSLWNKEAPQSENALLRELGGFSVAQSEYFYDGQEERGDWMWDMKWRARLRRFRIPGELGGNWANGVCGALGDTCNSLLGQLPKLENIIAH